MKALESPDERSQVSGMPAGLATQMERRTFRPDEVAARQQWTGVPLVQVPAYCLTLVAGANNAIFEVTLPDNISVVMFCALSGVDFAVSFGGRCVMPQVSGNQSGDFVPNDGIVSPIDVLFYCKGTRTLSVGIAANAAKVSIVGWTQLG